MTGQEYIAVARENLEALNAGDRGRFRATLAADSVYDEVGTRRRVLGSDRITEAVHGWKRAFPNAKGTITNAVAGDGMVALEVTWEGTYTGPLLGPGGVIAYSGSRQPKRAVHVFTFEGSKIKRFHQYYFDVTTLRQRVAASSN